MKAVKYLVGLLLLFTVATIYYAADRSSWLPDGLLNGAIVAMFLTVFLGIPHFLFQWLLRWLLARWLHLKEGWIALGINLPALAALLWVSAAVVARPSSQVELGNRLLPLLYNPVPASLLVKDCYYRQGALASYELGVYCTATSNDLRLIMTDPKLEWEGFGDPKSQPEIEARFRGVKFGEKGPWVTYYSGVMDSTNGVERTAYIGQDGREAIFRISSGKRHLPR